MANAVVATIRPVLTYLAGALAGIAFATAVHAVPIFYVSNQTENAVPGLLSHTVPPFSTGTLHIWANSDVRLSGVSLDLIETGGAIKFTGINVPFPSGPPSRWSFLDGPQGITDSALTNIGAAVIPGVSGDGIGLGSTAGTNLLIAQANYMTTNLSSLSNLHLRVGSNGIAEYNTGSFAQVRFGTDSSPLINGDAFGAGGAVGTVLVCCIEAPLIPVDANLGDRQRGSVIDHKFTVSSSAGGVTWSNLVVNGPGTPAIDPSLSADGRFTWNSTNSPLGTWIFDATVRDQFGPAVGHLTVNLIVPEPTSSMLALLALSIFGISVWRVTFCA